MTIMSPIIMRILQGKNPLRRGLGAAALAFLVLSAAVARTQAAGMDPEILFQRAQLERSLEERLRAAISAYLGAPNVVAVVNVSLLVEEARHEQRDGKSGRTVEYVLPGVPVDQELTKQKKGVQLVRSSDRTVRAAIYIGRKIDKERLDQARAIAAQILELDPAKGDVLELSVFEPSPEAQEVRQAQAETRRDVLSYTGAAATGVALVGILALAYFLFGPLRAALSQITEALAKRGAGGGGGGASPAVVAAAAGSESRGSSAPGSKAGASADEDQLFAFIDEESIEGLTQALARENDVLVASVLECLPRPLAAKAFALFQPEKRRSIFQQARAVRYANPESIKLIEKQIRSKLGFSFGGVRRMSRIIQRADRSTRAAIVADLSQVDPELAAHLRANLLEFEDLLSFDDKTFSRIFRDAGMAVFARYLKSGDPALVGKVAAKLAPEMSELLVEQVSFLPASAADAGEEEFVKIVDVVERLRAAGLITAADKVAVAQG